MNDQRPKFTFLGHSAVRCDLPDGKVMLIDPWLDGNPSCPEEAKNFDRVDAVLITHGHADHIGGVVELCKRYRPEIVVATYEICGWLESKGVSGCSGMNIGGTQKVLSTKVVQVQAFHTSSIQDGDQVYDGGAPTGFVVRLEGGYTFYHAGDTGVFMDMQLFAELYRPQLAFLPIGDHFTMGPQQAALACKLLQVSEVIPIHWGTFPVLTGTPSALIEEIAREGVDCEVIVLQPGESCAPGA